MPHLISDQIDSLMWALVGAVAVLPLLRLNMRYALKLGLIDWPKARGVAEDNVPIVGPSLILVSVAALGALSYYYTVSPWIPTTAAIMAIMGYVDDRTTMSAADKMFFQFVCVGAVVMLDPTLRASLEPYGVTGQILCALFLVGLINAINFIDGIDGLAALVLFGGAVSIVLYGRGSLEIQAYTTLSAIIAGMVCVFFYFNVFKRGGFLGNVGSYFFSYLLGVMHLSLPIESAGVFSRLSLTGLCFLVPIADASMVVLWRLWTRRSPFESDKGHLHHRLIQTSLPLFQILGCFALAEIAAIGMGTVIVQEKLLTASVLPVLVCASLVGIVALMILMVEKGSRQRLQSYFERLDAAEPIYYFKYRITEKDGRPISPLALRRLEARVSTEIRITDLCYICSEDTLFVTLRTMPEPLRGISSRIDNVFNLHKIPKVEVLEQGELVKTLARPAKALPKRRKAS